MPGIERVRPIWLSIALAVVMKRHSRAMPGLPEYRYPFNKVEKQEKCGCKPLSGGIDGQFMELRPTYRALLRALDITLDS